MKVIDLLNKIANGEEIPEKVKYRDYVYWYDKNLKDYQNAQVVFTQYLISCRYHNTDFLNDEVEIIEEERKPITKEDIEALGYACGEIKKSFENGWNKSLENKPLVEDNKIEKLETITEDDDLIREVNRNRYVINDLIDKLKYDRK